jgi:hypothetical protein
MKRLLALAFLISGVTAAGALAAPPLAIHTNTAGELADTCSADPRSPGGEEKINFCQGFAQGAITVELGRAGEKKPFCFPARAPSRQETMGQFTAWVKSMPERRSLSSTKALFQFLGERYPCK